MSKTVILLKSYYTWAVSTVISGILNNNVGIDLNCPNQFLKFIYSGKATKFCEISTVDLSYIVSVKSTVEILQTFVAFSGYMNFIFSLPSLTEIEALETKK